MTVDLVKVVQTKFARVHVSYRVLDENEQGVFIAAEQVVKRKVFLNTPVSLAQTFMFDTQTWQTRPTWPN